MPKHDENYSKWVRNESKLSEKDAKKSTKLVKYGPKCNFYPRTCARFYWKFARCACNSNTYLLNLKATIFSTISTRSNRLHLEKISGCELPLWTLCENITFCQQIKSRPVNAQK